MHIVLYLCSMCLQKVEKLTKEGEDSKSNHQPQSSVDSTYQLVGKRNTLEAAE